VGVRGIDDRTLGCQRPGRTLALFPLNSLVRLAGRRFGRRCGLFLHRPVSNRVPVTVHHPVMHPDVAHDMAPMALRVLLDNRGAGCRSRFCDWGRRCRYGSDGRRCRRWRWRLRRCARRKQRNGREDEQRAACFEH
jgi:hypothetical protein